NNPTLLTQLKSIITGFSAIDAKHLFFNPEETNQLASSTTAITYELPPSIIEELIVQSYKHPYCFLNSTSKYKNVSLGVIYDKTSEIKIPLSTPIKTIRFGIFIGILLGIYQFLLQPYVL